MLKRMKNNTITADVTFRLTQENDIALLPAIERSAAQAFRQIPAFAWLADGPVLDRHQHRLYLEAGHSLVAAADGQAIGFLLSEPLDDALFIVEVSVHQAWQGKGIGQAMIRHTIDSARRDGYPAVTLTTFRDVPWNAPFYTRLGFRMLNEQRLPSGLAAKRRQEIAHGLPPETRCAMRLAL